MSRFYRIAIILLQLVSGGGGDPLSRVGRRFPQKERVLDRDRHLQIVAFAPVALEDALLLRRRDPVVVVEAGESSPFLVETLRGSDCLRGFLRRRRRVDLQLSLQCVTKPGTRSAFSS